MTNKRIVVAHFHKVNQENEGRIQHLSEYPLELRSELIQEALEYGFDIQYIQAKDDGISTGETDILWVSKSGFNQR